MTTIRILSVTALLTMLAIGERVNGQLTVSTFKPNCRALLNAQPDALGEEDS